MMKTIKTAFIIAQLFVLIFPAESSAQTISPVLTGSCSHNFSFGGKSLSLTLGEPLTQTFQNGNRTITNGFHQPYINIKILNLETFIEGFYRGAGLMTAVLFNNGSSADSTACDSVTVTLHEATMPYNEVAEARGMVHINGSTEVIFPASVKFGSYYMAIHHRNAIETWSKTPVTIKPNSTIDFRY